MSEQTPEPKEERLGDDIMEAIAEHGAEAVGFAWKHYTRPMLPVAAKMQTVIALADLATAHGVDLAGAGDAVALIAALRKSADPHQAWLAGEIILRVAQDIEHLRAAIAADPTAERSPQPPAGHG
jgi:hypothetical protein